MNRKGFIKKILFLAISGLTIEAQAAGYKMEFQSVSVLGGNGEAAVVEDAGTNWYNAAGNIMLPQQSVFSIVDIYAPSMFYGTATAPSSLNAAAGLPSSPYDYQESGTAGAYSTTLLPAVHFVRPMGDKYAAGISIVPAWGFREDYGNDSIVRYNLVRLYIKTIDISPSFAYKITPQWSIGLGPDFNYFSVATEQHVRTQGVPNVGDDDSIQRVTGKQWKTGWHAGLLYQLSEKTRFGLTYRSKIIMKNKGYSDFKLNGVKNYESDDFEFRVPLPATATLSAYHELDNRWALLGTIAFDQWSILDAYTAKNVITPPSETGGEPGLVDTSIPQNMKDAWNFSVGTHYKWTDQWMLRGSFKYEQTPTNNEDRQLAFPDAPKYGLHIGSRYQMSKRVALDLAYGHTFLPQVHIHDVNSLTDAVSEGHSRTHIDFAGAQIVVNI